eukprot:2307647-Pleurochrysis_carterae.AAC.1
MDEADVGKELDCSRGEKKVMKKLLRAGRGARSRFRCVRLHRDAWKYIDSASDFGEMRQAALRSTIGDRVITGNVL